MTTKTLKIIALLSFSITINAQNDTIQSNDSIQILEWKPPVKKYAPSIKKEEKEALTEFVKFCKTQFEIDNLYKDNQHYSVIILNALGYDTDAINVTKSEVFKKLDEVLKNDEARKSFLSFFAKIGNNDYNLIYFSIKPATNSYYRSKIELSAKNADILTTYIINHYYYIPETPKQAESETKKQESIKYIAIEKEAVFKGGEKKLQEYIFQNLNIPESTQNFSGKVNVNFVIMEDGSIDNISIKPNVPNELHTEIERVFKNMPKWTPAQSQGKNIKMKKSFPLTFR